MDDLPPSLRPSFHVRHPGFGWIILLVTIVGMIIAPTLAYLWEIVK